MFNGSKLLKAASVAAVIAVAPSVSQAWVVGHDDGGGSLIQGADAAGYDLWDTVSAGFETGSGTLNLVADPLGTFNFPGPDARNPIGVGSADIIVHRLDVADRASNTAGFAPTIDIEIVALSLVSTNGVGFFGEEVRVTDVVDTGSTMDIYFNNDNNGFFNSSLNFTFDLVGVGSNTIYLNDQAFSLSQTGTCWSRGPFGTTIDDVNHIVNGVNNRADFFAACPSAGGFVNAAIVEEEHAGGWHFVRTSGLGEVPVASPATIPVLACAAAVFGIVRVRKARAA